jgi:hypothetical protein
MQSAMQSATQSFSVRPHDAVIRVNDEAGTVIETHQHVVVKAGEFTEP